jgi:dienelactone hydrolase
VNDVLAASDVLRKLDYVDNSRVFISGHSSGGTLALLAGMASPVFRGIASFGGSVDQVALVDGWKNKTSHRSISPIRRNLSSDRPWLTRRA